MGFEPTTFGLSCNMIKLCLFAIQDAFLVTYAERYEEDNFVIELNTLTRAEYACSSTSPQNILC